MNASSPRILFFQTSDEDWEWRNCYFAENSPHRFLKELRGIAEVTAVPCDTPEEEALKLVREHEILVSYAAPVTASGIAADPGKLKYICCIHGGVSNIASTELLRAGVKVTNWGDHTGQWLAYLSMTLLLALLRDLSVQIQEVRHDGWRLDHNCKSLDRVWGGQVEGLRVGMYGLGFAGRGFLPMARGMGFVLSAFDPYLKDWPADVRRVGSLSELFDDIDALIVFAALTDETRNSVSRDLLARLPDGGIVVNTARGGIIDQDALFDELIKGRLRAGLDVLAPDEKDYLEPGHPVRTLPNCILTCHVGPTNRFNNPGLGRNERHALENIRRFIAGEPLKWEISADMLRRMT